ncbi:hypothetical protein MTBBW1_10005 [Desulfamplus magnetovallimortis]|uniref:Uncharacterized protein n=1 Tax=Desulfamplus magnetovallimortis TaxID=1246637 RepID=A0A1W1H4F7_9BACT|nr:hypothetical protein MTBBW1_10005 [Desulfamplus magnetovallimortis]
MVGRTKGSVEIAITAFLPLKSKFPVTQAHGNAITRVKIVEMVACHRVNQKIPAILDEFKIFRRVVAEKLP